MWTLKKISLRGGRGPWFDLENLWLQFWRGAHRLSGWSNLKKFGFTGRNHLNGMKSWKYLGTRWPSLIWVLRNPMTESYVPGFWLWRMVIVLPLLVIFASYAVSISDLLKEAFTRKDKQRTCFVHLLSFLRMIKSKLYSAKVTRDAVDLVTAIMVSFKTCFQSKDTRINIKAFLVLKV